MRTFEVLPASEGAAWARIRAVVAHLASRRSRANRAIDRGASAVAAVGLFWRDIPVPGDRPHARRTAAAGTGAANAIAVLPFVNMTGDPGNDYLGDGLAEELTNRLERDPRPDGCRA